MHRMSSLVAVLLVPFALAQQDIGPRPIPKEPEAPTEARSVAAARELAGRAFAEDFARRHPQRGEGEAAAAELLREYGRVWGNRELAEPGLRLRLTHRLQAAMHQGADDPLLQLLAGDLALWRRDFAIARRLVDGAVAALASTPASPLVRHMAVCRQRGAGMVSEPPADDAALTQQALQLLIEAAGDPLFANGNERWYLSLLEHQLGRAITFADEQLVQQIAHQAGVPPYVRLVLEGRWHEAAAWQARGGGYANTVSEDGWHGFHQHLESASKRLIKAHELAPQHPEAPGMMVAISGANSEGQEVMRQWLDRAAAASADYLQPYESLLWFSMPRWGGTQATMLRFARECVATERYDTLLPDVFRTALSSMQSDYEDARKLWSSPSLARTLRQVEAGYRNVYTAQDRRLWELSQQVVELVLMRDDEAAARLYESLDGPFQDGVMRRYRIDKEQVLAAMQPHLQAHAPKTIPVIDLFAGYESTPYDPGFDYSPRPLPAPAAGQPAHQAALADWRQRIWVAAYRRSRHRAEPWDAAAEAMLRAYGTTDTAAPAAAVVAADLARAQQLLASGCDDPLVLYAAVRAHELSHLDAEAAALLDRALAGFAADDSSGLFRFYAARRLDARERRAGHADLASAARARMPQYILAAAHQPEFHGDDARWFFTTFFDATVLGFGTGPLAAEQWEQIGNDAAVDPWLRHAALGLRHSAAVMALHGAVEAAEVKEMFQHSAAAAQHLTAAHDLHPDWPEPATMMILLSTLDPAHGPSRRWFDRAVASRPDYIPAYDHFYWTRRPAFGGTRQAAYRFAVECLDHGSFADDVPRVYLSCLESLRDDVGNWRWIWAQPDVVKGYERLLEGAKAASAAQPRAYADYDEGRAVVAWAGGRYEAALAAWNEAGRKLPQSWLRVLDIDRKEIEADLRALADKAH